MLRLACFSFLAMPAGPAGAAPPAIEARYGFAGQMAAWNRGDLEGALKAYSPQIVWVNRQGVSRGLAEFAQAMRADFAGRPETMGRYSGEVLEARELAPDTALLVVRWSITRDGKRMMGGISTQLWKKLDGGWQIVLEHAG